MDAQTLSACTGATITRAEVFAPIIDNAMWEFGINSPKRQAAFLAQAGHESGGLKWLTELWGPTGAQRGYEGRADLGNTQTGDGWKYRGRGLFQLTGRANYRAAGDALDLDLISFPDRVAEPIIASRTAGWFWSRKGLNALADQDDFVMITRRINGGINGLAQREALWEDAKLALGV